MLYSHTLTSVIYEFYIVTFTLFTKKVEFI